MHAVAEDEGLPPQVHVGIGIQGMKVFKDGVYVSFLKTGRGHYIGNATLSKNQEQSKMAPPSTGWLLAPLTTRALRLPNFKSQASCALESALFW